MPAGGVAAGVDESLIRRPVVEDVQPAAAVHGDLWLALVAAARAWPPVQLPRRAGRARRGDDDRAEGADNDERLPVRVERQPDAQRPATAERPVGDGLDRPAAVKVAAGVADGDARQRALPLIG